MTMANLPTLRDLEDYQLVDDDQDIRGCPVRDRSGRTIGSVERMLVDADAERVAALVLTGGRTIAIEEIEITDDGVVLVDDNVAEVPSDKVPRPRAAAQGEQRVAADGEQRIPIVEERIAIGKRVVPRGVVRVRTRIVERPVSEDVQLRDEHVEIERRKVGAPIAPGQADDVFRDRTIEMTETAEEAVIDKRARVTEEVVLTKTANERVERVEGVERHTEVDVDRGAPGDQRGAADNRRPANNR